MSTPRFLFSNISLCAYPPPPLRSLTTLTRSSSRKSPRSRRDITTKATTGSSIQVPLGHGQANIPALAQFLRCECARARWGNILESHPLQNRSYATKSSTSFPNTHDPDPNPSDGPLPSPKKFTSDSDFNSSPSSRETRTSSGHYRLRGPWRFTSFASFVSKPPLPEPPTKKGRGAKRGGHELLEGTPEWSFSPDNPIRIWKEERVKEVGRGNGVREGEEKRSRWGSGPGAYGTTGEDFWFEHVAGKAQGLALGVADGVGGWIGEGVNPALFAQALMHYASKAVTPPSPSLFHSNETRDSTGSDSTFASSSSIEISNLGLSNDNAGLTSTEQDDVDWLDPHRILEQAYEKVMEDPSIHAGSSTACIVTIDSKTGLLRAVNLGDSSFIIIRQSRVIHYQAMGTWYFNAPKQLTKSANSHSNYFPLNLMQKPSGISDRPSDADRFQYNLESGDIVLLFTDGIADNMFEKEFEALLGLVSRDAGGLSETEFVRKVANTFVAFARSASFKGDKVSPFQLDAQRHRVRWRGGKIDDGLLICVKVTLEE